MAQKISRLVLVLILCFAVLTGAYLSYLRFLVESSPRSVELCFDLNDLKKMANFDRIPLGKVLEEAKKRGVTTLGVFEETLPEAAALGELYYAKGSGILSLKPNLPLPLSKIRPERTYLYIPKTAVRKRIYGQLSWVLGKDNLKFIGKDVLEVNEAEEEIRGLGLGLSEIQTKYLKAKGFKIVPRVWNDPRYHLGNVGLKVSALKEYGIIIFDGEEILGYPAAITSLASALKENQMKYGYIEIVKQDGDSQLRKLMEEQVVRVHSVPKDELKKISKEEALERFARGARERGVQLIYLRPFLPPQVEAFPVEYNLKYLGELKQKLEGAGFSLGRSKETKTIRVEGWQVLVLGLGVAVGGLLLLNYFLPLGSWLSYSLLILAGLTMVLLGAAGKELILQKTLSFLAAVIFPSYAVISTFSRKERGVKYPALSAALSVINVAAETAIGVLLAVGLLYDSRFMVGAQTFAGVKATLILPIVIIAVYFILKEGKGLNILRSQVPLSTVIWGGVVLVALGVFLARSGNFTLPVPALEKYFRNFLETIFFIRPRTKEFLVGYPLLFLAASYFLRGERRWLWLLAALGAIAPISLFNSFTHVHTPLIISLLRSLNGLVLGLLVGWLFSSGIQLRRTGPAPS